MTEVQPEDLGLAPDATSQIWRATERLYRTGVHPAITLCIRHQGKVVLDRAIGHARGNGPDESGENAVVCTTQTPFCIFSASKAITAMVVHLLDDRGALHIDDRVAEYIPEFTGQGKGKVTIRHVLSHRAGVPSLHGHTDLDLLADPDAILRIMCDAKPRTLAGRRLSYHAITGGFILGEVVKRATGKDIRTVLAEEILDPLGFEWMNYGVPAGREREVATNYFTGHRPPPPIGWIAKRALGVPFQDAATLANDPRYLRAIMPSANVVATANELSRFFELLLRGGKLDGVRIMEERTIRRARNETAWLEMDFTLGVPVRYGVGLMLGDRYVSPFGPNTERAFGHLGFINCFGWADPDRDISVGLLTSGKPALSRHLLPLVRLLTTISTVFPR
jgi:CubicO group peptidase (beta-lactamase class C family)